MYYIKGKSRSRAQIPFKILAYTVCIILTVLCIFPFVVMIVNSTRSTAQIEEHAISLIPSKYFFNNLSVLTEKSFDPLVGFTNSLIISVCTTACTIYFSTMTAFAIVAYDWKLKNAFFTLIMCVLMIPTQVTCIGFYQFIYKIGMTNSYLPLILPAIAAPSTVFFMRQYMVPTLPMEILQSARIDGAGEFRIFNQIVLPMMKPAMATQAIFAFVTSWNSYFLPSILITRTEKYTLPMMVNLLRGDMYKAEYGCIYLGLLLTVLPLLVMYFILSKYIIAGVALGGVKG